MQILAEYGRIKGIKLFDEKTTRSNIRWFGTLVSDPQLIHRPGHYIALEQGEKSEDRRPRGRKAFDFAYSKSNASSAKEMRTDEKSDASNLLLLNVLLLLGKSPRRPLRTVHNFI